MQIKNRDGVAILEVPGDTLIDANLTRADLTGADLTFANLTRADLNRASLSGADLTRADLNRASLSGADLTGADLTGADLTGADLTFANLTRANLAGADLTFANLTFANLTRANLAGANLTFANLSGAIGLLDPTIWLREHFETTGRGVIVYRGEIGNGRTKPEPWRWEQNAVLTEVVNQNRTTDCGSGVHFATPAWIISNLDITKGPWRRCLIEWMDLASVVVPYNTDGKARCGRLILLEPVSDDEMKKLGEEVPDAQD